MLCIFSFIDNAVAIYSSYKFDLFEAKSTDFFFFIYHDLVAIAEVPDLPFAGGSHRPKTRKKNNKELIIHTPIQTHICSFTP